VGFSTSPGVAGRGRGVPVVGHIDDSARPDGHPVGWYSPGTGNVVTVRPSRLIRTRAVLTENLIRPGRTASGSRRGRAYWLLSGSPLAAA
jgi:hypothetical protein